MVFDFFRQFILNPVKTGAITPSSQALADLITDEAGLGKASTVLEFGSGTGVFTEKIADKIKTDSNFVSFEINSRLAELTKKRVPRAKVINDSVINIKKHIKTKADVIISGLPWAGFNEKLQDELLDSVVDSLKPNGKFLTFAYIHGTLLPGGKRFRNKLEQRFKEVKKTRIVWRNLPPAFVYVSKKK